MTLGGYEATIRTGMLTVTCVRCGFAFRCSTEKTDEAEAVDAAEGHLIHLAEHEEQHHSDAEEPPTLSVWQKVKDYFGFTNAAQPKGTT